MLGWPGEGDDPGAVGDLVAGMEGFIVGLAGLPHFPEDLEPSLSQATQGARMALPFVSMSLVILLRPRHLAPAKIGPEVNGLAQVFIAAAAEIDFEDLTGLKGHGSRSGQALQALCAFKNAPIASQFAQKPRRQFRTCSGQ